MVAWIRFEPWTDGDITRKSPLFLLFVALS